MASWRDWRDREFLSAEDLIDQKTGKYREYRLEIVGVRKGWLKAPGGKQKRWFLKFKGAKKEYAANATSNKVCEQLAGSDDPKRWVGLVVTLFVTKCDSPQGIVDSIRFKNMKAPASATPDAIPDDEPAIDEAAAVDATISQSERAALEARSTRTGHPPQPAPPPNCLTCGKALVVGEEVTFDDHKHPEKGARHPGCVPAPAKKPVDPQTWTPEPPDED